MSKDHGSSSGQKGGAPHPLRSYPSHPKFAVMEHTMDVAGRVLYERREAHISQKDGKQILIVLIERSIDNQVIKTKVVRQGDKVEDEELKEETDLSDKQKEEFYTKWAMMWLPQLPKDETISPTMMEIYHIEPFGIMFPEESESEDGSEEGKAVKEEEVVKTPPPPPAEEDRQQKEVERPSQVGKPPEEKPKKEEKGVEATKSQPPKVNPLDEQIEGVHEEMKKLESGFEKIRTSERKLHHEMSDLRHEEIDLKHQMNVLENRISSFKESDHIQRSSRRSTDLGNKLKQQIEEEVAKVRESESKLKKSLKELKKGEKELQQTVGKVLNVVEALKQEEENELEAERRKIELLSKKFSNLAQDMEHRPRYSAPPPVPVKYNYGGRVSETPEMRRMNAEFAEYVQGLKGDQLNREDLRLLLNLHREPKAEQKKSKKASRKQSSKAAAAADNPNNFSGILDEITFAAEKRKSSKRASERQLVAPAAQIDTWLKSKSRSGGGSVSASNRKKLLDLVVVAGGKDSVTLDLNKATDTASNYSFLSRRSNRSKHNQISIEFSSESEDSE